MLFLSTQTKKMFISQTKLESSCHVSLRIQDPDNQAGCLQVDMLSMRRFKEKLQLPAKVSASYIYPESSLERQKMLLLCGQCITEPIFFLPYMFQLIPSIKVSVNCPLKQLCVSDTTTYINKDTRCFEKRVCAWRRWFVRRFKIVIFLKLQWKHVTNNWMAMCFLVVIGCHGRQTAGTKQWAPPEVIQLIRH